MGFPVTFVCLIQIGHIKKEADGALVYTVVNQDPEAEGTRHKNQTCRKNGALNSLKPRT